MKIARVMKRVETLLYTQAGNGLFTVNYLIISFLRKNIRITFEQASKFEYSIVHTNQLNGERWIDKLKKKVTVLEQILASKFLTAASGNARS